jgi:hypothetical protein
MYQNKVLSSYLFSLSESCTKRMSIFLLLFCAAAICCAQTNNDHGPKFELVKPIMAVDPYANPESMASIGTNDYLGMCSNSLVVPYLRMTNTSILELIQGGKVVYSMGSTGGDSKMSPFVYGNIPQGINCVAPDISDGFSGDYTPCGGNPQIHVPDNWLLSYMAVAITENGQFATFFYSGQYPNQKIVYPTLPNIHGSPVHFGWTDCADNYQYYDEDKWNECSPPGVQTSKMGCGVKDRQWAAADLKYCDLAHPNDQPPKVRKCYVDNPRNDMYIGISAGLLVFALCGIWLAITIRRRQLSAETMPLLEEDVTVVTEKTAVWELPTTMAGNEFPWTNST